VAIFITLLIALLLLLINKLSTAVGKDSPPSSIIFSDDEKNITQEKTFFSTKKKKAAVPGDTKNLYSKNMSGPPREIQAKESAKTTEKLLKDFPSITNDAKINLIINLESFEPDLLTLAFSDKSADVRLAAAKSLFWLETDQKNILPFIALAMNDKSSPSRDESYELMDSLHDKCDLLSLMELAMDSGFADARLKAVSKFIDTGFSREDVRILVIKALSDKEKEIRAQAILAAAFLWDQEFSSEEEAVKYISRH
jgi:hypothetical protein